MNGWIGVDLDGTLAEYHGWKGIEHVGDPVPKMLARVRNWLASGQPVRIVTARVGGQDSNEARIYIERWCKVHLGCVLPVTCSKDFEMIELWDDRCVQVLPNTGERVDGE